jgi:hypothetical protein
MANNIFDPFFNDGRKLFVTKFLKKFLIRRIHNFTFDPTLTLPYDRGENKRNSTPLSFYNLYKSPCNRGIMGV